MFMSNHNTVIKVVVLTLKSHILQWLPESPRFDLASGHPEKATKTLELAARVNGVKMPPGNLVPEPQVFNP